LKGRAEMCGRFKLMIEPGELRAMLGLGALPVELVSSKNISPGQHIPIVRNIETRNVEMFKWGLVPGWAKDPSIGYKMINARAETIAEKASFKKTFSKKRCLIPADGFYEWKIEENRKQPYWFSMKSGAPFTFAGLWEYWNDIKGNELFTCTIITTNPNDLLTEYHNRMPAILNDTNRWAWLENRSEIELRAMLKPYPVEEMSTPVRLDPYDLNKLPG
jgi:putative SOS response-associated peptidase YedK